MSKQENSYSSDLLAGGVGMFLGVLLSMVWNNLPTWPASAGFGGTLLLLALFVVCHYADDPVALFTNRLFQLIIGGAEGLLLMMSLFHY